MKLSNLKYLLILLLSIFMVACSPDSGIEEFMEVPEETPETHVEDIEEQEEVSEEVDEEEPAEQNTASQSEGPNTGEYRLIKVDGGDTSGYRESNVVVNIGHGNREYWAYTNEHGQLVRVTAKEIVVQNDDVEDVNSDGRYYSRMADVPGVGQKYGMDRGHVIADSLGGVANAYNITPQEATLNRHGDQAYMERNIRDAGGATDFEAIITYPDTSTQTPSKYKFTYTIMGNTIVDEFENKNPDKVNADLGITEPSKSKETKQTQKPNAASKNDGDLNSQNPGNVSVGDIQSVDTDSNGTVTIQEAKDAGFSMPIYEGHWLYEHMRDNNNNGMVGE